MNKQKRVLNGKCTIKPKLVVWDMQSIPLSLPSSSHQLLTLSVSNIACSSAADLHDVAHSAVLSFQLLHTLLHSCVGQLSSLVPCLLYYLAHLAQVQMEQWIGHPPEGHCMLSDQGQSVASIQFSVQYYIRGEIHHDHPSIKLPSRRENFDRRAC